MIFKNKIRSLFQLQELLEQDDNSDLIDQIRSDPAKVIREITELPDEKEYVNYKIRSIHQLNELLKKNPRLIDLLKHDPVNFIQKAVKEAPTTNYKLYHILIGSLCAVIIIIIIGVLIAWFTKNSREAPTLITAVACTILGMLMGILVTIPVKHQDK